MKGNTEKIVLSQGSPSTIATFQLPKNYVATAKAAPLPRGGLARRGFTRAQMSVMFKAYQENSGMIEAFAGVGSLDDAFSEGMSAVPVGPEWVFHGTAASWDTLYDSGGLQVQGDNLSVSEHVHSSSTHKSAYIATSRELSVAMNFAKGTGWIHLIYSTCGMEAITTLHKQAEIIIPGEVPIRDIFMFKQLTEPNAIYRNLDFKGPDVDQSLITHCLRLMGGGAY